VINSPKNSPHIKRLFEKTAFFLQTTKLSEKIRGDITSLYFWPPKKRALYGPTIRAENPQMGGPHTQKNPFFKRGREGISYALFYNARGNIKSIRKEFRPQE